VLLNFWGREVCRINSNLKRKQILRCPHRHLSAAFPLVNKSKNIYFVQTWFNASPTWNKWCARCLFYEQLFYVRPINNTWFYSLDVADNFKNYLEPVDFKRHTGVRARPHSRLPVCALEGSSSAGRTFIFCRRRSARCAFTPYVNYCRYASVSFCFIFSIPPLDSHPAIIGNHWIHDRFAGEGMKSSGEDKRSLEWIKEAIALGRDVNSLHVYVARSSECVCL